MIIYKTMGETLEYERKNKKLTKAELCEGVCDASSYARYENDICAEVGPKHEGFTEILSLGKR